MPVATNRIKYARAQEYVRSGAWLVDADAGVIVSSRTGAPLKGHVGRAGRMTYGIAIPGGSCIPVYAHRVIYESVYGPIPDGLEINHMDGNPLNNSLDNLEAVTCVENIRHAMRTGLRDNPARGGRLPQARLTEASVADIRKMLASGAKQKDVASKFGITQSAVSHVASRRSWSHVA